MILENWIKQEELLCNEERISELKKKLPTRVKRRRKINKKSDNTVDITNNNTGISEDINDADGWEEYYDYIFPDDEDQKKNLKILDYAIKWHMEKEKEKI